MHSTIINDINILEKIVNFDDQEIEFKIDQSIIFGFNPDMGFYAIFKNKPKDVWFRDSWLERRHYTRMKQFKNAVFTDIQNLLGSNCRRSR